MTGSQDTMVFRLACWLIQTAASPRAVAAVTTGFVPRGGGAGAFEPLGDSVYPESRRGEHHDRQCCPPDPPPGDRPIRATAVAAGPPFQP